MSALKLATCTATHHWGPVVMTKFYEQAKRWDGVVLDFRPIEGGLIQCEACGFAAWLGPAPSPCSVSPNDKELFELALRLTGQR